MISPRATRKIAKNTVALKSSLKKMPKIQIPAAGEKDGCQSHKRKCCSGEKIWISEVWKGMVEGHCRDEQFEEVSWWTTDFRTLCKRTRAPESEIKERRDEKNNKGELKHVLKMASMQMWGKWRERLRCFWKCDRRREGWEMRKILHRGEKKINQSILWTLKCKL